MSVAIVRLEAANAGLLDRIADDVFDEAIKPDRLAACLAQPNHIMVVAVSQGRVIGQVLAVVHHHPDKATELYVEDLAVAPSYRRQGIATRLLDEAIALGRERGCEEIWVGAQSDNGVAKAFYASLTSLDFDAYDAVIFEGKI